MMRKFLSRTAVIASILGLGLASSACEQIGALRAKMAFKDANLLYQSQDYRAAAAKYEEVVAADPNLTAAFFFLGNSYDNLYRPSRQGDAQNDALLTSAVKNYRKSVEVEPDPKLKKLALEYLVAAYGPDKLNDPSQSEALLQQMIQLEPSEPTNYFALARIYEDSGVYDQAEQMLIKAREVKPSDPAVYMTLAGYYNRQGDFDKTIEALQARLQQEPNNPEAHYTISTFYWDKAYRDFRLTDDQKMSYVQSGIGAIDKAIELKADYEEALVYKNLLLRLQANLEKDRGRQLALLKQADQLRDKAQELRKQRAAGAAATSGAGS
jgi:tetratricopeptide (TPR) repeat protein